MNNHSNQSTGTNNDRDDESDDNAIDSLRDSIIGLGERSVGKNYYPQLKQKIKEIEELNRSLEERVKQRTEALDLVIQEQRETNQTLKTTLEQLHRTQTKLIESEKMAALGGLVSGVAHEINTPVGVSITGISYFLELNKTTLETFNKGAIQPEALKDFLTVSAQIAESIYENLTQTSRLINNFKEIAVEQSIQKNCAFNLKSCIQDAVLLQTRELEKTHINVEINCDEHLKIFSNPRALHQIIAHLLANSLMHGFSPNERGTVDIRVLFNEDEYILSYADDGCGIKQEHLSKIFNPFFTTNRSGGGTGLGLNVVYNLVSQVIQGTIEYQSFQNQGTKFIIKFRNLGGNDEGKETKD